MARPTLLYNWTYLTTRARPQFTSGGKSLPLHPDDPLSCSYKNVRKLGPVISSAYVHHSRNDNGYRGKTREKIVNKSTSAVCAASKVPMAKGKPTPFRAKKAKSPFYILFLFFDLETPNSIIRYLYGY